MTKVKRSMKGNDGKARRKKLHTQIIVALSSTASFLFVLHVCGVLPRGNNTAGLRVGKQARLDALLKIGQHKKLTDLNAAIPEPRHASHAGKGGLLNMREALSDPDYDPINKKQAQQILAAATNLIEIEEESRFIKDDSYHGIVAVFCPLNFAAQKEKPPELPMFRDVVAASHCGNNKIRVDLMEAVELAREFDLAAAEENDNSAPRVLDLKGVVFHESRCGSTLAANSMMALNPEKNRVYSESSPPISAFRGCGEDYSECSLAGSANLLKDVIYMMGRSNDPKEENLFYKFQSATTRTMQTFREAFPTTPWIFLYREPVQVMMSQLDMPKISRANCVRSKNSSPLVHAFVKKGGYHMKDLEDEEFCAIHLATLCESALKNIEEADGLGMAVKYHPDLVHTFLDTVFPKHFDVTVDQAGKDRVLKISGTYSKNRGQEAEGAFKSDSEEKERAASQKIREASNQFLLPSFDALENSPHNSNNM